ncbi:hypothetical protein E0H50_00440 [Kribbella sindirgiensis]|uniref:Uncharacterized protein n=1 Tax=Kribbella sindirgiensis TaxID=1124744 RepID=A0A4R0JER1_9ACTN|nr:hypothetical protein E0H50_00440 [Kribbella sindirgiensis]
MHQHPRVPPLVPNSSSRSSHRPWSTGYASTRAFNHACIVRTHVGSGALSYDDRDVEHAVVGTDGLVTDGPPLKGTATTPWAPNNGQASGAVSCRSGCCTTPTSSRCQC